MSQEKQLPLVSVVVPVYQNAASLPDLHDRLRQVAADNASTNWEFVFVDDGSTDDSVATLETLLLRDARICIVRLSRNFGSQAAILAGMSQARGQAVAVISADLQDPPELLPALLAPWRAGTKVVLAVRARRDDPWPAKAGAAVFYWLFRRLALASMPPGGFDCCLLDRQVVDHLTTLRRPSFLPGEILWLGFGRVLIPYERKPRLARYGRSMWTFARRIRFATDAVWTFSRAPLQFIAGLGWTLLLLAAMALLSHHEVWLTVIAACTGLQLLGLAWVGEYVWGCQQSLRDRPPFVIDRVIEPSAHETSHAGPS